MAKNDDHKGMVDAYLRRIVVGKPTEDEREAIRMANVPGTNTKFHTLPVEAKARKAIPIATGCLDYFPDALAAVAEVSRVGNEQHNPGSALHWDRTKSTDEADSLMRHMVERGTRDHDGVLHTAKVAWRALALLQKEIENNVERDLENDEHRDKFYNAEGLDDDEDGAR
jgi:Domain of unknown function (DUF5664)